VVVLRHVHAPVQLQIVYGFIMGFAHAGYDGLHASSRSTRARDAHQPLVMWLLCGFMGAAYYIIPEEAERELYSPKLAMVQLGGARRVGVDGHHRLPLQLVGGPQVPRDPAAARLPRRRRRAALHLQHRHDHQEGPARSPPPAMVLFFGLFAARCSTCPG
jgi:hypothetical protein